MTWRVITTAQAASMLSVKPETPVEQVNFSARKEPRRGCNHPGHGTEGDASMQEQPIPVGLCQCGCGERTPIAERTDAKVQMVKGQPRRFVPGHHARLGRAGNAELCPAGHSLTGENLYITPGEGWRQCQACRRTAARESAARRASRIGPEERARRLDSSRRWNRDNRAKRAAQAKLKYEIKRGRIVRPGACDRCGAEGPVHGHHFDYSKPVDVQWLCPLCHMTEHREGPEPLPGIEPRRKGPALPKVNGQVLRLTIRQREALAILTEGPQPESSPDRRSTRIGIDRRTGEALIARGLAERSDDRLHIAPLGVDVAAIYASRANS